MISMTWQAVSGMAYRLVTRQAVDDGIDGGHVHHGVAPQLDFESKVRKRFITLCFQALNNA